MLRQLFYLLNFGTLAVFVVAVVQDHDKEWRSHQNTYFKMEVNRLKDALTNAQGEQEKKEVRRQLEFYKGQRASISQIQAHDLERFDRCTSCHVGFDEFKNPSLANNYDRHPYKAPDIEIHKTHNLSKFGCTVCHGGQGLATSADAAHGYVEHWEQPLLTGPFIQASCVKCHGNFHELKGAENVANGYKLFHKQGCLGCHTHNGEGGVVSVELGEIASKPLSRVHFEPDLHVHGPGEKTIKKWILLHLTEDTWKVVPGDPHNKLKGDPIAPSGMPPFKTVLSKRQAEDITAFLLGGSEEKVPRDYYVHGEPPPHPPSDDPLVRGRRVFEKYGCQGCHGVDAKVPWRNYNALGKSGQTKMSEGVEPHLPGLVGTYTREELKKKIQDGVPLSAIAKFKADGPTPPLYMPAWEDKIKGRELEDLVTWLLSLAPKDDDDWE